MKKTDKVTKLMISITALTEDHQIIESGHLLHEANATLAFDRMLNAQRAVEQLVETLFLRMEHPYVANPGRQSGQADTPVVTLPTADIWKDDPLCRLGDEGPIVGSEST